MQGQKSSRCWRDLPRQPRMVLASADCRRPLVEHTQGAAPAKTRFCDSALRNGILAQNSSASAGAYGLAYTSQQESPQSRFIRRSRKIRMRLGGNPDLLQPFPKRPRGMHQRTYMHLRACDPFVAESILSNFAMGGVEGCPP
jgi:hypothetical protein